MFLQALDDLFLSRALGLEPNPEAVIDPGLLQSRDLFRREINSAIWFGEKIKAVVLFQPRLRYSGQETPGGVGGRAVRPYPSFRTD